MAISPRKLYNDNVGSYVKVNLTKQPSISYQGFYTHQESQKRSRCFWITTAVNLINCSLALLLVPLPSINYTITIERASCVLRPLRRAPCDFSFTHCAADFTTRWCIVVFYGRSKRIILTSLGVGGRGCKTQKTLWWALKVSSSVGLSLACVEQKIVARVNL